MERRRGRILRDLSLGSNTAARLAAAALALAAAGACQKKTAPSGVSPAAPAASVGSAPAAGATTGDRVLARVNGTPITDLDLRLRRQMGVGAGHQANAAAPAQAVLETLIREELAAQEARAQKLDQQPDVHAKLAQAAAQMHVIERRELGEALLRKQLDEKSLVPEAEARKFFDDNAATVRAEFHVLQILISHDDSAIDAAAAAIKGGKSFEEVAAARFSGLPAGAQKPWDLGFLRWSQIPEAWWDALFAMKPGEVSPVIRNAEGRAWILKLVERRPGPEANFTELAPRIVAVLARKRAEERRTQLFEDLKKRATIELLAPPSGEPGP